jgi:hypothetical protein
MDAKYFRLEVKEILIQRPLNSLTWFILVALTGMLLIPHCLWTSLPRDRTEKTKVAPDHFNAKVLACKNMTDHF